MANIAVGTHINFKVTDLCNENTELRVQDRICDSSFGTVFRVTSRVNNRKYYLKVYDLPAYSAQRAAMLRLISYEVSTLKELNLLQGFKKNNDNTVSILMTDGTPIRDFSIEQQTNDQYVATTLDYIKNNKFAFGLKVLTYAVLTLAIMHGVTSYTVARILFWDVFTNILFDYFASRKDTTVDQQRMEYLANSMNSYDAAESETSPDDSKIVIIIKILSALYIMKNLAFSYDSVNDFAHLVKTAANAEVSLTTLDTDTMVEAGRTLLLFFPIKRLVNTAQDLYHTHFASDESILNACEKASYPSSMLSFFNLKTRRAAPQEEPNTLRNAPAI